MMKRRGDGFLLWLGTVAVGLALYAPHVGLPATIGDAWRLVVVPVAFGTVVSLVRGLADRL
jgi:hypothetical protein